MKPNQTAFKELKKEHNGHEVIIRGTSFDAPVKKAQEIQIYSTVEFFFNELNLERTRNFTDQLSQEDLDKEVEYFASNLNTVFPNEHNKKS
jgi:hypothetical protein